MQNFKPSSTVLVWKTLSVLIVFPIISTLISLLLLNRSIFLDLGLDFFATFWIIIVFWYLLQLFLLSKIISSSGWNWGDIGFNYSTKQTLYFIGGYFFVAGILFVGIEFIIANSTIDIQKLNSISSLIPKTTTTRAIFILMALVAGLTEEFVYRGFAIRVLESYGINKWLSVIIATIPFIFQHGLKSIDQFWWFLTWGVVFGLLFLWLKKLYVNIIIHWLVILSAILGILQVVQ